MKVFLMLLSLKILNFRYYCWLKIRYRLRRFIEDAENKAKIQHDALEDYIAQSLIGKGKPAPIAPIGSDFVVSFKDENIQFSIEEPRI